MDVLVIGYSSLVKRKVLGALSIAPEVRRIHIASRTQQASDIIPDPKRGEVICGYEEALKKIKSCIVYISLPNHLHYSLAKKALELGHHVVVDKPAFLNSSEAGELTAIANKRSLCLVEANAWTHHPMCKFVEELSIQEGRKARQAQAYFLSPALDQGNFRLLNQVGSGIIYDRASYAITAGRLVFNQDPVEVECAVDRRDSTGQIDLSCRIDLHYPDSRVLRGNYSLISEYKNSLEVIGDTYRVKFDRVFTPPEDYTGPVEIESKGTLQNVNFEKANYFALFFSRVVSAIQQHQISHFSEQLLKDAKILDKILESAKRN